MPKSTDLTGMRFGRWLVISASPEPPIKWLCRCDCGVERHIKAYQLTSGHTQSCGCFRKDKMTGVPNQSAIKHGKVGTKEWKTWSSIKDRCLNPKVPQYKNYGGRGITLCDEWKDDFMAFYNHIGPVPSKEHSLDRIDNSKGYEPGNVQWATKKAQSNNTRTNVMIEYSGRTQTLTQWAEELGIQRTILYSRHAKGWSPERMFNRPSNVGWQPGDPEELKDKHAISRSRKNTPTP